MTEVVRTNERPDDRFDLRANRWLGPRCAAPGCNAFRNLPGDGLGKTFGDLNPETRREAVFR
jgi:hypothetical protein